MGVLKKIKDFFAGGGKKVNQQIAENDYFDQATILSLYQEYIMSEHFNWYGIGKRYYKGENDILYRIMTTTKDGNKVIDNTQPNNMLNHCFAKSLIDQKVNYSFGKPLKLNCDNPDYLDQVQNILKENKFDYRAKKAATMASNAGIVWLHPYIDEQGKFKFDIIPAEQIIPQWADDMHDNLLSCVRAYNITSYEMGSPQEVTILEYWTDQGFKKYQLNGDTLLPYANFDLLTVTSGNLNGQQPHYTKDNFFKSWGKVPFIPFKNNIDEFCDVRYIKNLIDNYDLTRSDLGNALEQLRNFIIVLENAQGTDLEEFLDNLKTYGVIKTTNVDGSGTKASILSNPIDCEASTQHTQILKQNIIELLQGVNLNLELTIPPSGVALQLLYSGLDIKASGFETEFTQTFDDLMYFMNIYMKDKGLISNNAAVEPITIDFVRNMPSNVAEQIQNVKNSKGIVSDKTLYKHHPLVDNADDEEKQVKKESTAHESYFDNVPLK